jgi:hypothetical protein
VREKLGGGGGERRRERERGKKRNEATPTGLYNDGHIGHAYAASFRN